MAKKSTKVDLYDLKRWSFYVNGIQFKDDVYGKDFEIVDEYRIEKFREMQTDFMRWLRSLSGNNLERLAQSVKTQKELTQCGFRQEKESK
jgi:hypothetical protein|tara:strand:+ start:578 stop:847 length:270 start_codon:yes stop_codon:yes gene_type:complete